MLFLLHMSPNFAFFVLGMTTSLSPRSSSRQCVKRKRKMAASLLTNHVAAIYMEPSSVTYHNCSSRAIWRDLARLPFHSNMAAGPAIATNFHSSRPHNTTTACQNWKNSCVQERKHVGCSMVNFFAG